MTPSSSSTPIPIQASGPIAINPRPRHGGDDEDSVSSSSSSTDDEGRYGASALSAALRDSDSLGELRVGSLPVHLRRPGRAGGGGAGGGSMRQRHQMQQQGGLSGSGIFMGPQSLPPPRAPFLSSRGGPEDKINR